MLWLLACLPTGEQTDGPVEERVAEYLDLSPWLQDLEVLSDTTETRDGPPFHRIELQAQAEPRAEAEALKATLPEGIEAYITSENELDVDLRIYEGKQQTWHLTFHPRLTSPTARDGIDRPLIALVVAGLGYDGQAGQAVLEAPLPLTVAVEAFSPFSLLHSRDSALDHKELLVELPPEHEVSLALDAVPLSTGILLRESRTFADGSLEEFYLVDASPGEGLARFDVPMLAVTEIIQGDVESQVIRIENLADRNGAVLLMVELSDREAVRTTIQWLYESQERLRPVFVSEILDWQRLQDH